jgi:CRP-like cAMP-binding protein
MNATETSGVGRRLIHDKAHAFQRRGDDRKNGILACMPDGDFDGLKRSIESVSVDEGEVLFAPGERPAHVLFPVGAVVSLAAVVNGSVRMEMASVGCEGMVGAHVLMGGASTCSCAVVQRGGALLVLPTSEVQRLFDRGGASQHLFLRYVHSLLVEISQLAACNRHHSLHQRLCRWLLLNYDITPDLEILQTQDAISDALGVRREGVTAAAGRLRDDGAIRYDRGRITVLNREKLQAGACECYARLRKERHRLLPRQVAT